MNVSKPEQRENSFIGVIGFVADCEGRRQKQTAVDHRVNDVYLHTQAAAMSLDAAYGGSHVGKSGCTR